MLRQLAAGSVGTVDEERRALNHIAAIEAAREALDQYSARLLTGLDALSRNDKTPPFPAGAESAESPSQALADKDRRILEETDRKLQTIIASLRGSDRDLAEMIERHRVEFTALYGDVLDLVAQGRTDDVIASLPLLRNSMAHGYTELDAYSRRQRERALAAAQTTHDETQQRLRNADGIIAALAITWLVFEALLAIGILRPLRRTIETMRNLDRGIDPQLLLRDDELGEVAAMLARVRDTMSRLNHLAYRDPVTRLSNRARFDEAVHDSIGSARREGAGFAVLFLDLNHFKSVNDGFGYAFGDRYLSAVAERLQHLTHGHELLCRYGGDKFSVLLNLPTQAQHDRLALFTEASEVATRLMRAMGEPLSIEGHDLTPFISIGVALYPFDGESADELLSAADAALHIAKRGPDGIRFANRDVTDQVRKTLLMAGDLRRGLAAGEIRPHYQPIVNVESGEVIGVESLIRWQHPTEGLLLPDAFLGVARDTGLFEMITDAVLEHTFADAAGWRARGLDMKVAVNLSAQQLQPSLIERLRTHLDRAGLPADYVELEIVETAIMERPEEAAALLTQLRATGIHIGLDDFGTGYSSLSYLQRLPIDKIKIPQNFVCNIGKTREAEEIIVATLALAYSLGYSVVAEGVDNVEQMRRMRALRCPIQQGFLFSGALPADEFENWMRYSASDTLAITQRAA
jgi:diguanylate cyclase (GGDEF)-like protein